MSIYEYNKLRVFAAERNVKSGKLSMNLQTLTAHFEANESRYMEEWEEVPLVSTGRWLDFGWVVPEMCCMGCSAPQ